MSYGQSLQNRADQSARLHAEKRESVREIGSIPAVVDPDRKANCEHDLPLFLKTYMPAAYYLDWSPDHIVVLDKIQHAILKGGQFAEAMPRGSGKTAMCGGSVLWAILYGQRRFIAIIGAEAEHAKKIMESVMIEAWKNDRLYEDFPELCHAVRHIDGIGQRAAGQIYKGEQTHIRWNKDVIACPMIEGSSCGGAIVMPKGLSASIRGMQYKIADGTILRPDFALLDDPQTEESARSVQQCDNREELIEKAVLGLSGPDKKIAALMACTIIEKNDLSDRFLDHDRHPEWQGECMKMVYEWPDEQEGMWAEYAEIRRGQREGENRLDWERMANEFYKENREAMDKGSRIAWEQRLFDDELSALQHAENLLIDRGKMAFFSEYQNDPQEAKPALYKITAELVIEKVNMTDRFIVPDGCAFTVGFVDVNPAYGLNWVVAGFMGDMTGFVIDYGKHPELETQPLTQKGELEEQAVYRGLKELMGLICAKQYIYKGKRIPLTLMMLDCGYQMATVFRFIEWASANATGLGRGIQTLVASRGRDGKHYRPTKPIGEPGDNLHLTEFAGKGRVIVHNADYWRVHSQKAFLLPIGAPGSLSLFGKEPVEHKRFGEHMASEQLVEFLKGDIADSYNWHMKPGTKNDLLDCMVGCCVGACYAGARSDGGGQIVQPTQRKDKPMFKQHSI